MMVAAGGQENCLGAVSGYRVEVEFAMSEILCRAWIANPQVNVTDYRICGQALPTCISGRHRAHDGRHVHAHGGHLHQAVAPGPLLPRPVCIDLDAVALRIGKVKRLRNDVVGCAVDNDSVCDGMIYPSTEIGTRGQQESGMEK